MVIVEGIAISGEYVSKIKDKRFSIINKPTYEDLPSLNDPEKKERKVLLRVELADGVALDYYPNKISLKVLSKNFSYEMDHWLGKSAEFMTTIQKIAGNDRNVLYVCDKDYK